MKFLNRVFITLMAFCLAGAIFAFTLDQTLLKPEFVTAQLDHSGIYSDLATQLPKQLAGDQTSPEMQAALQKVITPQFLQSNLDTYLANLLTAVKSGAAIPPLDLTNVVPQIQAQGIHLTPEQLDELQKNLTITPGQNPGNKSSSQPTAASSNQTTTASQLYHKTSAGKYALALGAIIFAGLVFLTAPHHRLKALGHGFISTTIWLGILYAFFKLAPGIANHQLSTAKALSINSSVSKLVTLSAGGVAQHLLVAGIATLAIGIGLWAASLFTPHLAVGHGHDKGDKRTPLPSLFHKD